MFCAGGLDFHQSCGLKLIPKLRRAANLSQPLRSAFPRDHCGAPMCGRAVSVLVLPVHAPDAIPGTGASFVLWLGPVGRVGDPPCPSRSSMPCAQRSGVAIYSSSGTPRRVVCIRRLHPRDACCSGGCHSGRPCQKWYVTVWGGAKRIVWPGRSYSSRCPCRRVGRVARPLRSSRLPLC